MTSSDNILRLHWASSCALCMICWSISCSSRARAWMAQRLDNWNIFKSPSTPTIHNDCTEKLLGWGKTKNPLSNWMVAMVEIPKWLAPTSSFQKRHVACFCSESLKVPLAVSQFSAFWELALSTGGNKEISAPASIAACITCKKSDYAAMLLLNIVIIVT